MAARFDAWDADRDGKLSAAEVDDLIDEPKVTGPEAAALAVLKQIQRSDKYGQPEPDREMLKEFTAGGTPGDDAGADAPPADEAGGEPPGPEPLPNVDRMFAAALSRLRRANRVLFEESAPDLRKFRQGRLGDCFFLAPVGAAVARDPAAVRAMFAAQPDGSCDVAFPNGRTVRVPPLTDAELALTSSTEGDGVWLNVLEKAYGTIRNEARPEAKRKDSVTDLIAKGGSTVPVLRLLGGHETRGLPIRPKGAKETRPTEEATAAILPKVREGLRTAMREHRLVCCTTPKVKEVPGISPKHAYAVLGYDEAADTVRVWNPHGNAFKPKGAPGLERGYPTKDGHFTLPLADFARIFGGVQFEAEVSGPEDE